MKKYQAQYKRSLFSNIYNKFKYNEDYLYTFAAGVFFGALLMLYLVTGGN